MRSINKHNLKTALTYLLAFLLLFVVGYGLSFTSIAQFTNIDWGHGLMSISLHTLILTIILLVAYTCLLILMKLVDFIYPKS